MSDNQGAADPPEELAVDNSGLPLFGTGGEGPTIFADMIRGAYATSTVIKFNLFETKMNTEVQELQAKHAATVVLPSDQLRAWADFLDRIATDAGYPKTDGE